MTYRSIFAILFPAMLCLGSSCNSLQKKESVPLSKGERREEAGNKGVVSVGTAPSAFYKEYEEASKLIDEHKMGEAIRIYQRICEHEAPAMKTVAYWGLGFAYNMNNQHGQAIESYKISLQLDSTNFNSYVGLGTAYCHLKDYSSSVRAYEHAKALKPDDPDPYWGLAISYQYLPDMGKARENARKFIALAPDSKYRYVAENILSK